MIHNIQTLVRYSAGGSTEFHTTMYILYKKQEQVKLLHVIEKKISRFLEARFRGRQHINIVV